MITHSFGFNKNGILYFSLVTADSGQMKIQHRTVMTVPVATALVISWIRVTSKSPRFADPSRTTIINIIIKHKLDAIIFL